MDKTLQEKMEQKLSEIFSKTDEVQSTVDSLGNLAGDKKSFGYGIVIGGLYNSFYYQSRRILKRNPTDEEFSDFLALIKNHESDFEKNLKS